MIDIKDDEISTEMNINLARFFDYCCKKNLMLAFLENEIHVYNNTNYITKFSFTDFYFPKNLLRFVKEKVETHEVHD